MKKMDRVIASFMAMVMITLNVLTGVTTAWAAEPVYTLPSTPSVSDQSGTATPSNAADESTAPETEGPVVVVPGTELDPGMSVDPDTGLRGGGTSSDDEVTNDVPGAEGESETAAPAEQEELQPEKPASYVLTIDHVLTAEIAVWGEMQFHETTHTLSEGELAGGYDILKNAIHKDGMEVTSGDTVVTAEDFTDGAATAVIEYGVMDGYKAVYTNPIMPIAVYEGKFGDISINPIEQFFVNIQIYENGILKKVDSTVLEPDNGSSAMFSYDVEAAEYYTVAVSSEAEGLTNLQYNSGKITATMTLPEGKDQADYIIRVDLKSDLVEYKVRYKIAGENDAFYEEMKSGLMGDLTEAEPMTADALKDCPVDLEHYTVGKIVQQKIEGAGIVIEVIYTPNTYYVFYETDVDETVGPYIQPTQGKFGTSVTLVAAGQVPELEGYEFKGWSMTEGGDTSITSVELNTANVVGEGVHVYAIWAPVSVDYTLVYMTENADDDEYSYAGSVKMSALTGEEVTADRTSKTPSGFDTQHFTFESAERATVAGDGSTVIPVYYARNEYTLTFKEVSCGENEHEHTAQCYVLGRLACKQTAHQHNNNCFKGKSYELTAKYEADIRQKWKETVGYEKSWIWTGSSYTQAQVKMPGENKDVVEYLDTEGPIKQTLTYFVEVDSEAAGAFLDRDSYFKEFMSYITYTDKKSGLFGGYTTFPTKDEEFFEIDGYDRDYQRTNVKFNSNNRGEWQGDNKFYYTRKKYELKLYNVNGNGKDTTQQVPYTAHIKPLVNEEANSNLTFDGWYIDPEFTTQMVIDETTTMPKGLVLYGKWSTEMVTVTFEDEQFNTSIEQQSVPKGSGLKNGAPKLESQKGYIFTGWKDAAGNVFTGRDPIDESMTVYAQWEEVTTTSYTVRYVDENGSPFSNGGITLAEEVYPGYESGSTIIVKAKPVDGYIPAPLSYEKECNYIYVYCSGKCYIYDSVLA